MTPLYTSYVYPYFRRTSRKTPKGIPNYLTWKIILTLYNFTRLYYFQFVYFYHFWLFHFSFNLFRRTFVICLRTHKSRKCSLFLLCWHSGSVFLVFLNSVFTRFLLYPRSWRPKILAFGKTRVSFIPSIGCGLAYIRQYIPSSTQYLPCSTQMVFATLETIQGKGREYQDAKKNPSH